jgi:uncharacterized protein
MSAYYLDTSALVKRYARETGTIWISALADPTRGHSLFTVRLSGPEMIAALFRKVRVGELPQSVAVHLAQDFRRDWTQQYQILEVDATISERAMALAEKHALRGYDAVHLATGLVLHELRRAQQFPDLIFLAADGDLLYAAEAEGLTTDNPNNYP